MSDILEPKAQVTPFKDLPMWGLKAGSAYVVDDKGVRRDAAGRELHLIDADTGEVIVVDEPSPGFVLSQPAGWFHRLDKQVFGNQAPSRDDRWQQDFVRTLVRTYPGLEVGDLWNIAKGLRDDIASINSFSATLSKDPGIEMRDEEGNVVKGIKHGKKNNTYWPVSNAKRLPKSDLT